MPAISQIRFTNVVYEDGQKRYNDDFFKFDGYNGAIVLENGGGKTVLIQTLLQAVIPHSNLGERKIRDTLKLEGPAHIAIEWIISERPRRYVVTAVSLFLSDNKVDSFKYVCEYGANDSDKIEDMPFVKEGGKRPAERFEIDDYYKKKAQQSPLAKTFDTIKSYRHFLEEQYHIIADEWDSIVKINEDEGGIERFFDNCKTEKHLYDRLLIPTVEKSISGFNHDRFADTFEEQQKSLKLYKELREKIAEYEAIEEELTVYVKANEVLYAEEQQYEARKSDAKGVYRLADEQKERAEREIFLLQQAMEKLEFEQKTLEAHRDSYTIQLKEEEFSSQEEKAHELEEEKDRILENVQGLMKKYFSLMRAKQKNNIRVQTELREHYTKEIEQLDDESGATDLADELHTVRRELSGYFIEQQEKFKKELQGFDHQLRPIENELVAAVKEGNAFQEERMRLENEKTKKETLMGSLDKSMQKIRRNILSNSEEETVETRLPEWIKQYTQVDESIVSLQNDNKQNRQTRIEVKEKKDKLQDENHKAFIELAEIKGEIKRMEEAHTDQKEQLAQLSFSLSRIDSLYLRQSTAEQELGRNIIRMKEEKEEKLLEERLAHRFIDDYAEQDVFFADPFMEKQLQRWTNSIGLIDTGIRYLNNLDLPIEEQLAHYPYWPVTLITTENKKTVLIERIKSIRGNLIHPVHVIDLKEAKALLEENHIVESNAVLPLYWKENVDGASFDKWKDSLQTTAQRITGEREEIEEKLHAWESARHSFNDFFNKYPYEVVKEKSEIARVLKDELQLKKRLLERLERKFEELSDKIESNERRIHEMKDEKNGLERYILEGQQHENEAKEMIQLKEEAKGIQLDIEKLLGDIRKLEQRQRNYEDEKELIRENRSSVETRLEILKADKFYEAVRELQPLFTDKTVELLKESVESITRSLNKISSSRRELETKLTTAEERLTAANVELKRIQGDWADFDELSFPENGDIEIDQMRQREKLESAELEKAKSIFHDQKTQVAVTRAKLDELHEAFKKSHAEIEVTAFSEPLHIVQNRLQAEKEKLNERNTQYNIALERLIKELERIQSALMILDRFVEAHHFKSTSVAAKQLSENDVNEFTYEPLRIVDSVTTAMKQGRNKVEEERNRVITYRQDFHSFVRQNMSDAKMRDNLFQGLEYKREYTELFEFQQNIRTKMNSIIRFNEESIRKHDEQLEHFVTHIHEHVRTVVRELKTIPTSTKINFSSGPKQLYNFNIPEWDETDGLARLRAFIDEILEWIEHPRYMDADGKVNSGKIRTDIEKWFGTPQLLRIILQNGEMKVSCRKVTNDNEVTSRSFSWRESNEWSGGEKWSKNMSLFLGLLKYVAEKKKLLDTSMKRNRAVVLDNPFGKASSEHVLSPVFFIAEKLGFQIIALTAHAEGKFLRDYFPVIYSCRLRSAQNTEKMIMTKEKAVNTAYFQDNDPAAFERIGESEQLTLLD